LLLYLHGASGRSDDGLVSSNVCSYGIPLALEALLLLPGSGDGAAACTESGGGAGTATAFPFGVLAPVCPRSLRDWPSGRRGTLEWKSRPVATALEELLRAVLRGGSTPHGGGPVPSIDAGDAGGDAAAAAAAGAEPPSLSTLPPFDAARVYLTGMSMGGLGAYALGADLNRREPPLFAAVVPICGGGRPLYAPLLARTAMWFFHAANDNAVGVVETDALVNAVRQAAVADGAALEQAQERCRYTRFERLSLPSMFAPFEGHNSWDDAYASEELWRWMLAQGCVPRDDAIAGMAAAAAATAAAYMEHAYARAQPPNQGGTAAAAGPEHKWQWGKGKGGKGKGGKGGKGASFAAELHARDVRAAAAGGKGREKGKNGGCVLNGDE
jgi:dienelactone hydrolase